jgi:hypothetical protein
MRAFKIEEIFSHRFRVHNPVRENAAKTSECLARLLAHKILPNISHYFFRNAKPSLVNPERKSVNEATGWQKQPHADFPLALSDE